MNDWHDEGDVSVDLDDVAAGVQRAPQQFEHLLNAPVPLHNRVSQFFAAAVVYGKPTFSLLPPDIRETAQTLGFEPSCYVLWGHLPVLLMSTPQFVGPDGYTKLEVYQGRRFYIQTMFADGTGVTHTNNPAAKNDGKITYFQSTGDFLRDYYAHLETVRRYVRNHETLPIFSPTPELIKKRFSVFFRHHVSAASVVMALGVQAFLIYWVIIAIATVIATAVEV